MNDTAPLTYTNPRRHAELSNWPMGGSKRGTAIFDIETKAGKGERGVRTTRLDGTTKLSAPKYLTFARKARIVDGSDGRTYFVLLNMYGGVNIMRSDMQIQHEYVTNDDARFADLLNLFAEPMTEEQIERAVERKTNALDAIFMATGTKMTQAEYDAESRKITEWADAQYRTAIKS